MNTCAFCHTDFPSPQSFYAHCRRCPEYLKHKEEKLKAALGSSLKQEKPKASPHQPISAPIPPLPPSLSDPMAPFLEVLQRARVQSPQVEETQEAPQQKRRRLLQAAKIHAIDHYWSFTGTVTTEMRGAVRLRIDREMRNEPLEEWTSQEVNELADSIRDRSYNSFLRPQEKEAQRTREAKERTRRERSDEERSQRERHKRKLAFLNEARRRAAALLKTRPLSLLQRLQVMEEILTPLDATLTGTELPPKAYASIDAVLQARVADWEAEDAAEEAKQQAEWMEIAAVILGIIALGVMYVKVPEILLWLLNILWPEPMKKSGATDKPTGEAPCPASDQQTPRRRIRRIRRPSQSPPPGSPLSPSSPDNPLPHL